MTLKRVQAVYAVAQKHDLVIVEDDPYYWLVLSPYNGPAADGDSIPEIDPGRVALEDVRDLDTFARSLPRSYLSIDVDGRVLRLDSFSKCFARKSSYKCFLSSSC
jgi:aromatic amino acid aminotransferase I